MIIITLKNKLKNHCKGVDLQQKIAVEQREI